MESRPYLQEHKGIVRLRFNPFDVQSAMSKQAPDELVLHYTQTMVDALDYGPDPRHIGFIGLGGGSIQKHCFRHFPEATLTVAEINPEVIALRDHFHIPKESPRFRVYCEDGAVFVQRHKERFDALLVDGYDIHGQSPQLCTETFYADCYRALTPEGVLIVNVCNNQKFVPLIRQVFHDQVLLLDNHKGCYNTIVVACKRQADIP